MHRMRLVLTRDELITFLAMLGLSTMNGLDDEPLGGLDEREIAERLNRGEQSLLNRGLLNFADPNEPILDDALVALVGGAAVPDATFSLSLVNSDGSNEPHYFHATPQLLVEQHSPRVGIYQFDYVPDMAVLTERVHNLLEALPSVFNVVNGVDLQINSAILASFIELVQDRLLDDARTVLVDAGVEEVVVNDLLADYTTYPSWVGVVTWDLRSGEPQGGETVMVIGGNGRCWLLENVAEQSDMMRVRQVSRDVCLQALTHLLEPLNRTYHPST